MNVDIIEGNWKQLVGKVKEKWGKLTDDDLTQIAGKKDQLVGKIQEKYGITKEEAERELSEFTTSHASTGDSQDTRGIVEKIADAITGDKIDDKTGRPIK